MNLMAHCRKNGIYFHRFSVNAVRFAPTETYRHKRMKFEVAQLIQAQGGTFATEYPIYRRGKKVGEVDIVWLEEMIAIEFETNYTEEKAIEKGRLYEPFNTFVIDIGPHLALPDLLEKVAQRVGILNSKRTPDSNMSPVDPNGSADEEMR